METACLSIKFTPLIKEAEKRINSNCCLEIVPEVSRLQNLDKLKWDGITDCIEYTVPMTYTIILRKLDNEKRPCDAFDKTYHSCVDLLLSPFETCHDITSDNISRIISDTLILSTLPSSAAKEDSFISNPSGDSSDVPQRGTATDVTVHRTPNTQLNTTPKAMDEKLFSTDTSKLEPQRYDIDRGIRTSCDVVTNTESILLESSDDIQSWASNCNSGPLNCKRRLTLSPICSVNTQSTADSSSKSSVCKAITCNLHDPQIDIFTVYRNNVLNLHKKNILSEMVSQGDDLYQINCSRKQYTYEVKSPPAIRIAQYIRYIETELYPLNVFLDNLIIKCTLLGVRRDRNCNKNDRISDSLLYKSVSTSKKVTSKETCEKITSNRAVYSIILDE